MLLGLGFGEKGQAASSGVLRRATSKETCGLWGAAGRRRRRGCCSGAAPAVFLGRCPGWVSLPLKECQTERTIIRSRRWLLVLQTMLLFVEMLLSVWWKLSLRC